MRIGTVIPVGPGRAENLMCALRTLAHQDSPPEAIVVVLDGPQATAECAPVAERLSEVRSEHLFIAAPKHEPGMEQPRNIGVRALRAEWPEIQHVHFWDSDLVAAPTLYDEIRAAYAQGPQDRILVCPYEWMPPGVAEPTPHIRNDPRWPSFDAYGPTEVRRGDLAAGLACFSGNLVWNVDEFQRIGGFWNEIGHGRAEDGELGLRAVAMDVGISFARNARAYHVWHEIDTERVLAMNARDVPMLNERHPWVERGAVFMVDRDGKAFDVRSPYTGEMVPTIAWWAHAALHGGTLALPIR